MENFFKTEEGKIIGHVIHDSNTGIGFIRNYLSFTKRQFEKNGMLTQEDLDYLSKGIDIGLKRIKDAVDYGYTKFKERQDA